MYSSGFRRLSQQLGHAVSGGAGPAVIATGGIGAIVVGDRVYDEMITHNDIAGRGVASANVRAAMRMSQIDAFPEMGEITESESAAAFDTLHSAPEMMLRFLPTELVKSHPEDALKMVQSVMDRPDVMALARRNLAKHKRIAREAEDAKLSTQSAESSASQMWEQLRETYPCVLCQDVLAAPTLMDCTHTLCGSCSEELLNRCVPCDPNNDGHLVYVSCPTCRAEVLSEPRYERLLDQTIEAAVRNVPACALKTDWEQRRAAYMDLQRAKAETAAKKENALNNTMNTNAARFRAADDLNMDLDAAPSELPEYANSRSFWATAVTFVVIAIVCALRHRGV